MFVLGRFLVWGKNAVSTYFSVYESFFFIFIRDERYWTSQKIKQEIADFKKEATESIEKMYSAEKIEELYCEASKKVKFHPAFTLA